MCEPITMGMMALSAAQAGMGIAGARQQAKMQEAAQNQQMAAENERFRLENTARRAQQAQELEMNAKKTQELIERTRAAKSTARLAALEGGVGGSSVNALINDYERQSAQERYALSNQEGWSGVNSVLQDENAQFGHQQRLIGINQPIEKPNYLGEAIKLGGNLMGDYQSAQSFNLQKQQLRLSKASV